MATNVTLKPKPLILRLSLPEIQTEYVRKRLVTMAGLRLKRIQMANGYLTDFGLKVHRGQVIVAEPETPSVNFWDVDETPVKSGSSLQENTLTLVVATYDKVAEEDLTDDDNPDELCEPAVNVLIDIERAMYHNHVTLAPDPTFDGMAKSLTLTGKNYVTGLQGALWIQTVSTFALVYNTRLGDPYQQTAIS